MRIIKEVYEQPQLVPVHRCHDSGPYPTKENPESDESVLILWECDCGRPFKTMWRYSYYAPNYGTWIYSKPKPDNRYT